MEIGEFQKQFVILFFQEESNEIKVESNGFIWIRDSYFYFLIISKSYEWICKINRKEQIVFSVTHVSQF